MAAQNPCFALQDATGHTAELFRRAVASLINPAGGVVNPGDLAVTALGTPAMMVDVAEGQIWVPGTISAPNQALYYCFNDATVALAIAAADPTNPRIDIPCATVVDAAYGQTSSDWLLQVITGTPAPSPTAPALPANSLGLAVITVPPGATTITSGDIASGPSHAQLIPSPSTILTGVTVGTAPPAGTPIKRCVGNFFGATDAYGNIVINTSPAGFSYGYVPFVQVANEVHGTDLACTTIPGVSTLAGLTTTVYNTATGAVYASGAILLNYDLTGA